MKMWQPTIIVRKRGIAIEGLALRTSIWSRETLVERCTSPNGNRDLVIDAICFAYLKEPIHV